MKKIYVLLLTLSVIYAAPPAGYYDAANGLSGTALKAALHAIIDDHDEYSYDFLWTGLRYTDEDINNSSNFILLYSGRSEPKSAAYPIWNREHSWPKSHGDFGTSAPAGTDMHHLRPTDTEVNSARGSKDYDNGGSLVNETTDCYTDGDSFEPRDEVKGDCARMMFYMVTRYEGDASGEPDLELVDYTGTSGSVLGKLSTLIAWHNADPPDDWEKQRNDRVEEYQKNRNPFIDHPEYVAYIWGGETPGGLTTPVANAASNVTQTSFTASWESVNDASGYELYLSENSDFSTYLTGYGPKSLTGLSESLSGLSPNTNYYYKVKAYNSSEESAFSNTITVQTLANVFAAPVAYNATNIDSTSFTASWSSVSSATFYKLYVAEDAAFSNMLTSYNPKLLNALSEDLTGLTPHTNYYYKVKAVNTSEESDFSNVVNVQTLQGGGSVNPGDTHIENFSNFSETGSSYNDGSFIGQDGSTWTYDQCRGDQIIENETPCLGKGRSPEASITSGSIEGGIASLSVQYMQAFSTDVSLDVFVNDIKVATLTSSNESGQVKESGPISVNETGNVVIKFVQSSSESGQVAIDNVTWTSVLVGVKPLLPLNCQVGEAYPNPFNPRCTLPIELKEDSQLHIALYDLLGKEKAMLFNGIMSRGTHLISIDGSDLSTGMYLIKVDHGSSAEFRKVLLLK